MNNNFTYPSLFLIGIAFAFLSISNLHAHPTNTMFNTEEDADCDGIEDAFDLCPGGDDSQDTDGDGTPDCLDWDGPSSYSGLPDEWKCGNNKVIVCHIPPGNPANAHDICVNKNAVSAHLNNHGDFLGSCWTMICEEDENDTGDNLVSIEICNNGIDDDGDGQVDCEDGDCDLNPSCQVGGGNEGGLESETTKDLAAKIAARDFKRTTNNIDKTKKQNLVKVLGGELDMDQELSFRDQYHINQFMPSDVFPQTESYISTPQDLVNITNADQVSGLDIFWTEEEHRIGAVLGIRSDGVYQHAKYICDRVKGAQIREIFIHSIDEEHNFIVTHFQNRYGSTEYSTNISLHQDQEDNFILESHWDLDAYPSGKVYYNFQIWANNLYRLESITNEILHNLREQAPIKSYNMSGIPAVYAKELYYENGFIHAEIINSIGAESIILRGSKLQLETSENEDFEFEVALSGDEVEQISIETGGLYSFGADIVHNKKEVADVIFTADGFWGLAYNKDKSEIEAWEITQSNHEHLEDASWIERNFEVKGETENYISVYRSLNPAFRAEDFSDFDALTFEIEGSGEIEIVIVQADVAKIEDQMRHTYQLSGNCQRVVIPRSVFENEQEWDEVRMIYFTQRNKDSENIMEVDLKISNVAFTNILEAPECKEYNELKAKVFPNPASSNTEAINFKLDSPDAVYNLIIADATGKSIILQKGTLSSSGLLSISRSFPSGIYFYRIELPIGTTSGKFLIQE